MISFLKKLFRRKRSEPVVVGYQPLPSAKRMDPPPSARSNTAPRAFAAPYGRAPAARASSSSSSTPRRTESSSDDLSNPLNPMSPLYPSSPLSPANIVGYSSEPARESSSSHCSSHTVSHNHDTHSHVSHDYSCSAPDTSGSSYDSGSGSVSSD